MVVENEIIIKQRRKNKTAGNSLYANIVVAWWGGKMKYTTSFRNSVLKKILPPSNRSVTSVSKETGVAVVTINNWLGEAANHRICSLFLIRIFFDYLCKIHYIYIVIWIQEVFKMTLRVVSGTRLWPEFYWA